MKAYYNDNSLEAVRQQPDSPTDRRRFHSQRSRHLGKPIMKISAVIETIDGLNGVTRKQITKLQKTAEGRPILRNFSSTEPPLGIIRGADLRDGKLFIVADWTAGPFEGDLFLAPMHTSEYELLACGTTLRPTNRNLSPVRVVSEDES